MSFLSRGVIFSVIIGFFLFAGPLMALSAPFNPSPFPTGDSPPIIQLNELSQTYRDSFGPDDTLNPTLLFTEFDSGSVQNFSGHKDSSTIRVDPVSGLAQIGNIL